MYEKLLILNRKNRIDSTIPLLGTYPREIKTVVHAAQLRIYPLETTQMYM